MRCLNTCIALAETNLCHDVPTVEGANAREGDGDGRHRRDDELSLGLSGEPGLRRLKTSTSSAEAGPPSAAVSKLTQILATATQAGYGRRRPSTVPNCEPATKTEIASLASFIGDKERLLVITGAGCSTESNIPDYRSPTGAYSSGFKPMTHQEFLKTEANQRRYWARSFDG